MCSKSGDDGRISGFRQALGPTAEQIREKKLIQALGSMRPLAELLLEWYDRRLAEEEAKGYDKRN